MQLTKRSLVKVDNIKKTAFRLFKLKGLNNVTMGEIASEAKVSKVTLYKYFKDKQFLYETLVRDIYNQERDLMREIEASKGNFHEKMNAIIELRVNKYFEALQRFFSDYFVRTKELDEFMAEFIRDINGIRQNIYTQGRDEGLLSTEIKDETIDMYFEVIQTGLASKYHDLSNMDRDTLTSFLRLVYTGIVKEK